MQVGPPGIHVSVANALKTYTRMLQTHSARTQSKWVISSGDGETRPLQTWEKLSLPGIMRHEIPADGLNTFSQKHIQYVYNDRLKDKKVCHCC